MEDDSHAPHVHCEPVPLLLLDDLRRHIPGVGGEGSGVIGSHIGLGG